MTQESVSSNTVDVFAMPFIGRDPETGQTDYWQPNVSGIYPADYRKGRKFADALIQGLKSGDRSIVLNAIVQRMVARGTMGAVECGFFHRLGAAAKR